MFHEALLARSPSRKVRNNARTEPYTNLAGNDFVATLDWILHEKDALRTRAVAPIPALDEVVRAAAGV